MLTAVQSHSQPGYRCAHGSRWRGQLLPIRSVGFTQKTRPPLEEKESKGADRMHNSKPGIIGIYMILFGLGKQQ